MKRKEKLERGKEDIQLTKPKEQKEEFNESIGIERKPRKTPLKDSTLHLKNLKPVFLIICPFCKNRIPSIALNSSNGNMNISVKCQCLTDIQQVSLREYIESQTDLSLPTGFKIECNEHKKPYSFYCKQCEVNCCSHCLKDHESHVLISIHCFVYPAPHQLFFNEIKSQNKQRATAFFKRLEVEDSKVNQKMKEDIQSALETNELINEDLELLFHSLRKTASMFKSSPSYELMKHRYIIIQDSREEENIERHIKATQMYCMSKRRIFSIEKEFEEVKAYLKSNYVLKQCPKNGCFATLQGHTGNVLSVLQLTDGRLASCSSDRTIKLWNLSTKNALLL